MFVVSTLSCFLLFSLVALVHSCHVYLYPDHLVSRVTAFSLYLAEFCQMMGHWAFSA